MKKNILTLTLFLFSFAILQANPGKTFSKLKGLFIFKPDTTAPVTSKKVMISNNSNQAKAEKKSPNPSKFSLNFHLPIIEKIGNASLFSFISDWYGTKYVFGGTSKKGIDCSAFTRQLVRDVFCLELPRVVGAQFSKCVKVAREELKPGDLVFFETYRPGLSHVGYYLGDNKFIHAGCSRGVTIEDLESPYYKKRFRTGGRIKELGKN